MTVAQMIMRLRRMPADAQVMFYTADDGYQNVQVRLMAKGDIPRETYPPESIFLDKKNCVAIINVINND